MFSYTDMKSDVLGSLVPKLPKVHQRSSGEPIVGDRPLTRVKATNGIDHFLPRVRGLPVWSASAFGTPPFPSCLPSSRLRGAPAATPTNAARLLLSAVSASHGMESPRRMPPRWPAQHRRPQRPSAPAGEDAALDAPAQSWHLRRDSIRQ